MVRGPALWRSLSAARPPSFLSSSTFWKSLASSTKPQIMERQSDRSIHFTPGFRNSQLLVTALHRPAKKAGEGRIYVLCSCVFTRTSGRKELVCVPQNTHPQTQRTQRSSLGYAGTTPGTTTWGRWQRLSWYSVGLKSPAQYWCNSLYSKSSPPPPTPCFPTPPPPRPTPRQLSVQTLHQHLCVQSQSATACSNICAQVQNPKHRQPHHWLDAGKYCAHG